MKISEGNYISFQILLWNWSESKKIDNSLFFFPWSWCGSSSFKQRWSCSLSLLKASRVYQRSANQLPALNHTDLDDLFWSSNVISATRRKASTPILLDRLAEHRQIRLVAAFLPASRHCILGLSASPIGPSIPDSSRLEIFIFFFNFLIAKLVIYNTLYESVATARANKWWGFKFFASCLKHAH